MTRILSPIVDSKNPHTDIHAIPEPTLTAAHRFHIARSNIDALEIDFHQQILWLNELLRLRDISTGAKDIHSASQQISNLIEHVNDKSMDSDELGTDLEHLRHKVRVLEKSCDWSKPVDDVVNTVVRLCQDETARLKRENEFLRTTIRVSKDKGNERSTNL